MPLSPNDLLVHAKHYKDGYPLCWELNQEGTFEASWDDTDVTCEECLEYLKEE
jgi:hypothetical protein